MQERFDATLLPAYCALVELAALDRAPAVAEPLYEVLRSVTGRGVTFSRGWVFLLPRVLGVAAAVSRWWDRAEGHFRSAIGIASDVQAQPELGRTYLDYAHMLLTRRRKGDRARAMELAGHAQLLFEKLGMGPFARDASQLAEHLQSRNPRAPQRRTSSVANLSQGQAMAPVRETRLADDHSMGEGAARKLHIILVTNVEGSMALLQRLGDAKSHELLGIHNALIRACLHQYNGTEVTHTGD